MKGLEEYIEKHGKHFTNELADAVTNKRWNFDKVAKAAQSRVYYNVTSSTLGDIVYIVDMVCSRENDRKTFTRCIKEALSWVQDYKKQGSAFCIWLTVLVCSKEKFDFTPYL